MDRNLDLARIVFSAFAAGNIVAAMYYQYRYTVGPSSSKNFHNAQIHWILSGVFVIAAVVTDRSLSTATTIVIAIAAILAPAVPVYFLRRIRAERAPTFLDEIAMDDIIDRAHNTPD